MKLKISSFTEEKQIVRSELTCQSLELDENGLVDPVTVEAKIAKTSSCLTVDCNITLKTQFNCDRCLDEFVSKIKANSEFIITSDPRMKADSEDIMFISSHTDEVDISPNIRDAILLAIPFKKLCDVACKGLCPSCGKNLNEGNCDCKDDSIDPRWDKLKEIK